MTASVLFVSRVMFVQPASLSRAVSAGAQAALARSQRFVPAPHPARRFHLPYGWSVGRPVGLSGGKRPSPTRTVDRHLLLSHPSSTVKQAGTIESYRAPSSPLVRASPPPSPLLPCFLVLCLDVFVRQPLMKYLWRADYLQCPKSCDMDMAWTDCQCSLNKDAVAGQTPSEASAQRAKGAAGVFFSMKMLVRSEGQLPEPAAL